jgi:hypothetical protein
MADGLWGRLAQWRFVMNEIRLDEGNFSLGHIDLEY